MISDGRSITDGSVKKADICIIGAGVAGITLAKGFVGSPYKVIMLESGGLEPDAATEALNDGIVETPVFGELKETRLRFFGGTSNQWNGFSAPLEPIDFIARPWVENSGWPIDLNTLNPYYNSALGVLELPASTLAYKPDEKYLPFKDTLLSYRFKKPLRFGQTYRQILSDAPNIEILLHSNLVKMTDNTSNGTIASIDVATLSDRHFKVEATHYIMACGTLENTRILLNNENLPVFNTIKKHGWLGKCFMQHPHIDVGSAIYFDRPVENKEMEDYVRPTWQYQQQQKMLNCTLGIYGFRESKWEGARIPQYIKHFTNPKSPQVHDIQISLRSEQSPNRNNFISLTSQRDALGVPRVKVHWQLNEVDVKSIKNSAWLMARVLGKNNVGTMKLADWIEADKLPGFVEGGCHHMGTTRMSDSPDHGVVNQDCRVHGIGNLYVAGSGVFPTSGWADPTFTIIALALRLGDHLKAIKPA